ncbi:MAG: RHS repeat-associated core domain-containing protein [Gemmatimonadetes bacterium]|nr:RHS repeat-associated core domain-containing protein [Gemmatimonadota bacterium]
MVVNRSHSEFGAGWYLAGVENLVRIGVDTAKLLWVGGDGSAKVYRKQAAGGPWLAPSAAFRDTILKSGSNFERHLKDGVQVTFDNLCRHLKTTTKAGHVTTFRWGTPPSCSGFSRLLSITVPPSGADSASRTYNLAYNCTSKRLTSITDPASRVMTVNVSAATSHDSSIAKIYDPDGDSTAFSYNSWAQMTRRTNRRQYSTSYAFSTAQLQPHFSSFATPLSSQTDTAITTIANWFQKGIGVGTAMITAADTATVYTTIDGPRTDVSDVASFWIDKWGAPTKISDPLSHQTLIARDSTSSTPAMPTRLQYADGRVLKATYDARANVLSVTDSTHEGSGSVTPAVTRYHYGTVAPDAPDSIITPVDTITITYSAALWLPRIIRAQGGHKTEFKYDSSGVTSGLVRQVVDTGRFVDTASWAKRDTALVTAIQYDFLGNDSVATSPKGGVTRFIRDSYRRVQTAYDPMNHQSDYGYDLLNRLTSSTIHDGTSLSTSYRYTRTGGDSIVQDPRGVTRSWQYDAGDRQTVLSANGYSETRYFGPSGLVDSVLTRNGYKIRHTYDADGRLTQTTYPDATITAGTTYTIPGNTINRTYDAVDRVLTVSDSVSTVARVYNREGTVRSDSQAVSGFGNTVIRSWYDDGDRKTKLFNGVDSVRYTYGSDGLLSTLAVQWGNGGWGTESFSFFWDQLGRRDSVVYPNSTKVGYGYDRDGNLRYGCSSHPGGNAQDYLDYRFRYGSMNADGSPVTIRRDAGASDCAGTGAQLSLELANDLTYDARHELLTYNSRQYTYDASGNRIASLGPSVHDTTKYASASNWPTWTINLIVTDSIGHNHLHDGSRYWDASLLVATTRKYLYSSLGQLAGEYSDGSLHMGCAYDGFGRRVKACLSGGGFAYDGDSPVSMRFSNYTGWRFIQGPGLDNPLVGAYQQSVDSTPVKYYYLTDGRGRQLAFTNDNGDDRTSDNAFTSDGGDQAGAIQNSHGFANGRAETPNTAGLSYYRNRYYDQKSGRFLTEDPIGIAGGVNLYQYAGNNPATYTDPFGLQPCRGIRDPNLCLGMLLAPAQGPLEIAGTLVTLPLGGGIGRGAGIGSAAREIGEAFLRAPALGAAAARVIGHYPAYLQVAEGIGAKAFDIPAKIWGAMSEGEQWASNQKFLDRGIKQGAEFILGTLRSEIRAGSPLEREVNYLLGKGYQWAENGMSLIPR